MKYERMVTAILHHVGGKENITNLTHCYTRLRFVLKDNTKADKDELGNIKGVKGVSKKAASCKSSLAMKSPMYMMNSAR